MITVPLPCARPPYCLWRHTLLLRGCLATVVNKRHIAYTMHVTLCIYTPSRVQLLFSLSCTSVLMRTFRQVSAHSPPLGTCSCENCCTVLQVLSSYMPAVGGHLVKINFLHANNLKLVKISSLLPSVRRRPVLVLFVDLVWLFILVHFSLLCL
jgi:hypothetical protein